MLITPLEGILKQNKESFWYDWIKKKRICLQGRFFIPLDGFKETFFFPFNPQVFLRGFADRVFEGGNLLFGTRQRCVTSY